MGHQTSPKCCFTPRHYPGSTTQAPHANLLHILQPDCWSKCWANMLTSTSWCICCILPLLWAPVPWEWYATSWWHPLAHNRHSACCKVYQLAGLVVPDKLISSHPGTTGWYQADISSIMVDMISSPYHAISRGALDISLISYDIDIIWYINIKSWHIPTWSPYVRTLHRMNSPFHILGVTQLTGCHLGSRAGSP